ncbi:MAG: hypothetical protein FJ100_06480 [Deltaproteobacteria bacterium]|nr:hypothetical protein [Deltaproteobacteria bacterium]
MTALVGACQGETADAPASADGGSGGVAAKLVALSTCGGAAADPFGQIKTLELKVRDGSSGTLKSVLTKAATASLGGGKTSASFSAIPAGSPREVTVLGYAAGATTPTWFGRRTGVNIKKNDTTTLDMALMAVEGFTCVGAKNMPNALFAATTVIDNGRVLISGGFTNASPDGNVVKLESASNRAYIFDPNTGKFTATKGFMQEARAGHAMIYLAKPNQVLIVGGTKKMSVASAGNAPPLWSPGDAANLTYEIFDIATGNFIAGPDQGAHCKKRVFPNLLALTDDYVVSLGGAPWPHSDTDYYAKSDLYEAKHGPNEPTGRFKDVGNALQLNAVRAGAAVAYVGPTPNGTSRYLVWGGNTVGSTIDCTSPLPTALRHAERFKESTEPGTGEFFGDYVLEGDFATAYDSKNPKSLNRDMALFFPTLTPLGRKDEGGKEAYRFLSVGGARHATYHPQQCSPPPAWEGAILGWQTPSLDDAYILTLVEPTDTTKGRLLTKRVAGLGKGVFLHQANLAGTGAVVLTGGFSTFGGDADFSMQYFDIASGKLLGSAQMTAAAKFVLRGGHSALSLRNDCVLLYGGADKLASASLNSTSMATSDVYCPKFLIPN